MTAITHPKIADLGPSWAPFLGCSIIFDCFGHGGDNKDPAGEHAAKLYCSLRGALLATDIEKWRATGFCPLPSESFHLTLADLVHTGNVRRIATPVRKHYLDAEGMIRSTKVITAQLQSLVARSGILDVDPTDIAFDFAGVFNRSNRVVVVGLSPADGVSQHAAFDRLIQARESLGKLLAGELGLELPAYQPHITIGYFANSDAAPASMPLLSALGEKLAPLVTSGPYSFGRPALYGFHDMATFELIADPISD